MNDRVLFVDDDEKILSFAERSLGRRFDCITARSGEEALRMLTEQGPIAVMVTDDNMPGMKGTQLLAGARKASPDTTRIMLTGYAEQSIAVDAVNEGAVFRFLNKPIRLKTLMDVVDLGVRQYRLVTAERELLDRTLRETVRTLADMLAIARPEQYGRAARLRRILGLLKTHLPPIAEWELATAAALAQIGCVGGYDEDHEARLAADIEAGAVHIAGIPRLEAIAGGIRYQRKNFDGSGYPEDGISGRKIPLLGRVLRLAIEWDRLESAGMPAAETAASLRAAPGLVDPDLLEKLAESANTGSQLPNQRMRIDALSDRAVLAEDLRTDDGEIVVCRGHRVDALLRRRLRALMDNGALSGGRCILVESAEDKGPLPAAG